MTSPIEELKKTISDPLINVRMSYKRGPDGARLFIVALDKVPASVLIEKHPEQVVFIRTDDGVEARSYGRFFDVPLLHAAKFGIKSVADVRQMLDVLDEVEEKAFNTMIPPGAQKKIPMTSFMVRVGDLEHIGFAVLPASVETLEDHYRCTFPRVTVQP